METIWNDGHRFSGRVALVTGAGGTLGGAVAGAFGREGASVVVGYRRSQGEAESVVAGIVNSGGAASAHQLDVTDQASVAGFVAAMLTFDAFAFVQCSIFFFAIAALGLRLARLHDLTPS